MRKSLHAAIDFIPIGIYTRLVRSNRGRCHETSFQRDRMRRLRAGFVTLRPGGVGSPSVPTTWDCPQGLDVGRMKAGESPLDKAAPGSTVPRTEIAADGALRGGRARYGTRRRKASADWLRLVALHPLGLCPKGTEMKAPPRLANNRGGAALADRTTVPHTPRHARA